jgi:hypothetical protein
VRSYEIRGIAIQDKVFMGRGAVDNTYAERRAPLFIVALQCGVAGGPCFSVSMQAGPRAESGFDLALTEVLEKSRHYFVVQAGSDRGAQNMGREMPAVDIPSVLKANYENARWNEVAERCLTCAN